MHLPKDSENENSEANGKEKSSQEEENLSKAEVSLLAKISRSKLVTSKHEIEVQRQDPFSPLHSVKSFEALHL